MIDESVLERLLRDEAAAYAPPPGGPAAILAATEAEAGRGADGGAPRPRRPWLLAGGAVAASLLVAVALAPVVTGRGYDGTVSGAAGRPALNEDTAYDTDGGTGGSGAGSGSGGGDAGGKPVTGVVGGTDVVRTGEVSVEVPKERVRDALRDVTRLAGTHGGYVSESSAATSDEAPSGYVVLRVPVAAYDRAVEDVGRIGDVRMSQTRGEDVSGQVTDVAARLRSATAARDQLRTLLARATDVGDVLAVQNRIDEVQTEIEKLRAAQESLKERTTYGTLNVSVSAPPGAAERGGFSAAWHDAVRGFVGGFEALVAASGTIAFALLVGTLLFVLGRRARRLWIRDVV